MTTDPIHGDNRDDQELANALAGLSGSAAPAADPSGGLSFEETPTPNGAVSEPAFGGMPVPTPEPTHEPVPIIVASPAPTVEPVGDPALDGIKKDALNELRPLVDKLNVGPEEKFDTYLLLLRSTDDSSLIGPAHEAAKDIPDEARRAQALLDVIKEIDYLTNQNK